MSESLVNLESLEELHTSNGNKTNGFDSILDSFIISSEPTVAVNSDGDDVDLFRNRLETRIKERYIEDIVKIVVIDDVLYLKK